MERPTNETRSNNSGRIPQTHSSPSRQHLRRFETSCDQNVDEVSAFSQLDKCLLVMRDESVRPPALFEKYMKNNLVRTKEPDDANQPRKRPKKTREKEIPGDTEDFNSIWLEIRAQIYGLEKTEVDPFHYCSENQCLKNGGIHMLSQKSNVYGCIISGMIHICNVDHSCPFVYLNPEGEYTCMVSGLNIGPHFESKPFGKSDTGRDTSSKNFFDNDEEAMPSDRRRNVARRTPCANAASIHSDSRAVIYDLLYNSMERARIDNIRVKQMNNLVEKRVREYYKSCDKREIFPNRWTADFIYDICMIKRQRLLPVEHSDVRLNYYTDLSRVMWDIALKTEFFEKNGSKFNTKQHMLGMLYIMQAPHCGYDPDISAADLSSSEDTHHDPYLYMYLPSQNDLKEWKSTNIKQWKYCKNDVTKGRNNIKGSINSISDPKTKQMALNAILQIYDFFAPSLDFDLDKPMPLEVLFRDTEDQPISEITVISNHESIYN